MWMGGVEGNFKEGIIHGEEVLSKGRIITQVALLRSRISYEDTLDSFGWQLIFPHRKNMNKACTSKNLRWYRKQWVISEDNLMRNGIVKWSTGHAIDQKTGCKNSLRPLMYRYWHASHKTSSDLEKISIYVFSNPHHFVVGCKVEV